jgi:hypothetical protein
MSNAIGTVTSFLQAADARNWQLMASLLDATAVVRNSADRIYVGHPGIDDWRQDVDASTSRRFFEIQSVRALHDGYVMVVGIEHHDPRHGIPEAVPGAWIYVVRDERVAGCMYFRTERDALASLTGPGRREPIGDVLERCADAFNRDDFDALIANLDSGLRFRPVLLESEPVAGLDAFTDALVALRVYFDDVLVEGIEVDEIGRGYAIATTAVRLVDDEIVSRRRLAHVVRIVDGRIAEWLPFERIEAARVAVAVRVGDAG